MEYISRLPVLISYPKVKPSLWPARGHLHSHKPQCMCGHPGSTAGTPIPARTPVFAGGTVGLMEIAHDLC